MDRAFNIEAVRRYLSFLEFCFLVLTCYDKFGASVEVTIPKARYLRHFISLTLVSEPWQYDRNSSHCHGTSRTSSRV